MTLSQGRAVILYDHTADAAYNTRNLLTYGTDKLIFPAGAALGTQLNTMGDISAHSGFFGNQANALYPTLDRSGDGYTYRVDALIDAEDHSGANGPDRAGFSLIAISNDLKGIELGFWGNEVWAQDYPSPYPFHHGEGGAWNTAGPSLTRYDVAVKGDNYTVYANGNAILGGALRDYSPQLFPYNVANFTFLGDDTTSARADFTFGRVEVLDAAVPEPSSLALLLVGVGAAVRRRRRG
jgi:hypothetical protein